LARSAITKRTGVGRKRSPSALAQVPRSSDEIASRAPDTLIQLWRSRRLRGANVSLDVSPQDLKDLASWGANVIRIVLADESLETEPPFRLKETGLQRVDQVLEAARTAGLRVVFCVRAAAGRKTTNDPRIWEQPDYHLAFARQWHDLAARYRNNRVIAGYDLLSEPDPEVLFNGTHRAGQMEGTTADWNLLAKRLTLAVREVDPDRPLIVEAGAWAYARGFAWLKPTGDANTIYSFHMFSPHRYTHQDADAPFPYPGTIPAYVEPEQYWDARALKANLQPVLEFQRRYKAPIYVGEFGVKRTADNANAYLRDLLKIFEEAGWHWTFWRFRDAPEWNPEYGPQDRQRTAKSTARAPLLRTYREHLTLNDHPTFLQDLPLLKDSYWVEPMRAVHRGFTGTSGTVGLLGDSITYGSQFFTPLFSGNYNADPKTLDDLRRFRETVPSSVADWKTAEHGNKGGWRVTDGLPGLPQVLLQDNPEIAIVMFGTNDLNDGMPKGRNFEANLRRYLEMVLANGTVPILSTLPPKKDLGDRVAAYNEVIRLLAQSLKIPLMDFNGAILRRRPEGWYRTLIMGDGVHPTFPEEFQRDFTETGLRESGFTLRNFLAMETVLSVLDRLRQPDE
jgi:lysophospholipase L1-like esterase